MAAWFGLNNIRDVRAGFAEQLVIFRRKHAWLLAWLYTVTFGSFIGFSAVFPALLANHFPGAGAAQWAFVGPLLGALVRPIGGWLSDRVGGANVTFWNFTVMLLAAIGLMLFMPVNRGAGELTGLFVAFTLLFVTAGIGNALYST